MGKPKRKAVARFSDRDELIEEFRAFREAEGLPFDPAYVPRSFANIRDLDDGYAEIEHAAHAAREVPPPSYSPPPTYSQRQVDRKFDLMLETVGRWVGERIGEALKASVEPMRRRIQELENREFGGTWQAGRSYSKNAIVSHDGSGWIALRANPEGRPGTEDSGWRLFVKKGRDAPRERPKP